MKIEELYKLRVNKECFEKRPNVLDRLFSMFFTASVEERKKQTIKFLQAIIDNGYIARQELYEETVKVNELYYREAIKQAIYRLAGKVITASEEVNIMFLSFLAEAYATEIKKLKINVIGDKIVCSDKQNREFSGNIGDYILMLFSFLYLVPEKSQALFDKEEEGKYSIDNKYEHFTVRTMSNDINFELGKGFLRSKIYLRFLEKRAAEIAEYIGNEELKQDLLKYSDSTPKALKDCESFDDLDFVIENTSQRFLQICKVIGAICVDYSLCSNGFYIDDDYNDYPFIRRLKNFGLVSAKSIEISSDGEGDREKEVSPAFAFLKAINTKSRAYTYLIGYKGARISSVEEFIHRHDFLPDNYKEPFKSGIFTHIQKTNYLSNSDEALNNCIKLVVSTLQEYLLSQIDKKEYRKDRLSKTNIVSRTKMHPTDIERFLALANRNILIDIFTTENSLDFRLMFSSYDFSDITPLFNTFTTLSADITNTKSKTGNKKTVGKGKQLSLAKMTKDLESKNKELSEKIKDSDSQIEKLNQQNSNLKNKVEKYQNQENINSELRKKLSEKDKEIDDYKNKIADLQEIIAQLQSDSTSEQENTIEEIPDSFFKDKKILVIGGRWEIVDKLKELMPELKHTQNVTDNFINPDNYDFVLMFTDYLNHSLFYKYITRLRHNKNGKVPVLYLQGSNMQNIKNRIYNFYGNLK